MNNLGQKLWNFCHILRHDGVDNSDYIEQLTYLLFLKMSDERGAAVPAGFDWQTLRVKAGTDLLDHYALTLSTLQKQPGILSKIYNSATPRLANPQNLKRLINLIDEDDWSALNVDVKGEAFEDLLERSASEGKKGAGQYFTPRPLIHSIVRVMQPDPRPVRDFTVCDPACGTGGFLVAAYEWLMHETGGAIDQNVTKRIKTKTYYGYELVPRPARLAMMNLFLHGVTSDVFIGDTIYQPFDGLSYDCILANPPFGTKGANQAPNRADFMVGTTNKQLNFVQHILTALKKRGRAAIVLPDNVLFESKAGDVFENLMKLANLHTILRLPRGTFTPYAQGVKANVIFLQKGPATDSVWIYDARANVPGFTKKDRPLTDKFFADFEAAYGKDPNGRSQRTEGDRFRRFTMDDIKARDYKLDITWLKDESLDDDSISVEPLELATDAIHNLEAVILDLKEIVKLLEA